jgi:hypothetical protein
MLSLLIMLATGCDFSPPPPKIERKPKAPKVMRTTKKPKSGSSSDDSGEADVGIINEVSYTPERPGAFDDIEVVVDTERDGAYVDVDVTWYVNGRKLLSQRDTILRNRNFSKGDSVQAEIVAKRRGETEDFAAETLIIGNAPPRILTNPNSLTQLDGFRVRAEDPDGGRVTYHVKGGPDGLSIGENTGVVRYKPSKEAEGGTFDIVIVVRDEDAVESEWRFQVNIRAGSESTSAKAEREKKRTEARAKADADAEAKAEAKSLAEQDEN